MADWARAEGACTARYAASDVALAVCFVCCRRGHLCCASTPAATYRYALSISSPFDVLHLSVSICSLCTGALSMASRFLLASEAKLQASLLQLTKHCHLHVARADEVAMGHLCRPSCYSCGEAGHTAPDCRREKPIAVRNERKPGYSQRSAPAPSHYGYADDYSGNDGGFGG